MNKNKLMAIILFAIICTSPAWTGVSLAGDGPVLRVAAPWGAKSLDLMRSGFIFSRMSCLERLVQMGGDGRLTGMLAESWTTSNDRLVWTFKLRSGVRFHDGSLMTAQDAAASLNKNLEQKGVLAQAPISSIEAVSTDTLVIRTDRPFSTLPAFLFHYSTGIPGPSSFDEKGDIKTVIGTGPFKLVEQEAGKFFKFEAFDDYWGQKPHAAGAEYHAVPKGETRAFMLQAGQAELSFTLSPADGDKLKRSGDAQVLVQNIPRVRMLKLNCESPFFSDKRVRQAISLAIDRDGISSAILNNPEGAATQLLAPNVSAWHDPNLPPLTHDPQRAARLLEDAGWEVGQDGVRVKNGETFDVDLLTYSARPMLPLVATAIQDQLAKVGINVTIRLGDSGEIPERHKDGTLEMALMARNYGQIPEPIGNLLGDFAKGGGPWGAMGWHSDAMIKDMEAYVESFDESEKKALRSTILAVIQEELPVIPVNWYENIVAYKKGLQGVKVDPLEADYYLADITWAD
jgi:peptide/nickel transport system substrate-binding protein